MINLIDIQESIWNALSTITEYTVVDYIEFDSIVPPFIRLGNLYFDDNSLKNNEGIKAQQSIKNVRIEGHQVYVKQGHLSLGLTKDQTGSIFQRLDRNNNKYYHAVLVYDIYIN